MSGKSTIESEGATIDEAIEAALAELGIQREEARVEILSDARKGMLGFGGQKARVRVSVRAPLSAELLEEPAERPRARRAAPASRPATDVAPETKEAAAAPGPSARAAATSTVASDAGDAVGILEKILRFMEIEAEIGTASGEDGEVVLEIRSEAGGLLIGRHGQTLDALEYLLNRMTARGEETSRVIVDTEGYRQRRQESLREMALRGAERARTKGRPQTLSPMTPRDRRVIHVALQDEKGVTTRSTGQGYLRRVEIVPERSREARR